MHKLGKKLQKSEKFIGFLSTIKKSYRLRNIDIIGMSYTDNSNIHSDNFIFMTPLNYKLVYHPSDGNTNDVL